ncbi:MAG: hypothetical protein IM328_12700 [Microcystis sp. M034S1]|uniref:plasmid replication protein, CyRepA1 family n=1 Tax=Microcystis sp. M034S1 TaxID=2771111 RepID=UPI0025841366|nr:plasmid replication protein, CyRepA1 family [Microcystis sp. M034S1]MCA2910192.1 hypothetical protein [Microcystis sp. M034S1]
MAYTSSRFVQLKGNCPICLGEHKSCKQNGDLIHCRSHSEPPQGFSFVGEDGIGFAMYAPARDASKPYDFEASRAKSEARLARQAKENEQALEALPSIEERDRKIKSYSQKVTKPQNDDLLRRGLTQTEIKKALSNHWLFGLRGGYGIAAYDPISQLLCGAQKALDDRTEKKYTWGVFTGENQLKETGENPLFVWVSPDFDSSKPYQVKFCEGALKSLIRAFFEWRSNPQIIVIGGAGGIFGSKALERVLRAYPDATSYTLLPDADSQNIEKLNLYRAYGNLAAAIPSLKFGDWQHWQDKGGKDCDETYNTDAFNGYALRSPQDWLSFFDDAKLLKERDRALAHWQKNKAYTPNIRLNSQTVFDGIPIPDVNSIIAIKSDFGTQKTRGMKPHLKHWQSLGYKVILGGYRNALLTQTVKEWSKVLTNFMLMKVDPTYIRMAGQHLAACLDQFTRAKCASQDFDKSILVLDEADAVELHLLTSGTLKDNRSEVYSLFCEAVKRADVVYLMSAGLTDATVKFIADIRGGGAVIKYQNDFINKQKFILVADIRGENGKIETSSRAITRTMINTHANAIATNPSQLAMCIVCDSQNELKALELEFIKLGLGDVTFRYDSETSDTKQGESFAVNSEKFILENSIKILLISPSGNSGISIEIDNYFGAVYALYFGVIDVDSFLQMPMRVRDLTVPRYIASPQCVTSFGEGVQKLMPENIETSIHEFIDDFGRLSLEGLPIQDCLTKLLNTITDKALNDLQFKRFAQIAASQNYEKAHLRDCVERRLNDLGHSFTTIEGGADDDFIKALKNSKDEVKTIEAIAVFESENITTEAAKAKLKTDCPYPERLKIEKALIKETLPNIENSKNWNPEFIKFIRSTDRDFLRQLDLRYLAFNPDISKAKAVDRAAYFLSSDEKLCPQDVRSPLPYLEALKKSGALDLINYQGDDLHGDHEAVKVAIKTLSTATNIRRLGFKQGKKESNIQFLSRVLSKLGYGTNKARYSKDRGCWLYAIADKSKQRFEKVFESKAHTFLDIEAAIASRYRAYKNNKKIHDFEQILEQKTGVLETPQTIDTYRENQDHPQTDFIKENRIEGDPKFGTQNQGIEAAILPMAIEPTAPKSKNAIQWQKGMSAMYQGVDWAIATLGTATAKIVRNGFELWVDIPELAIADKNNLGIT